MNRTEESARDSLRSSVSSPGMPNTYWTPSASRHSTKTSEARRSLTLGPYLNRARRPPAASRALAVCLLALAGAARASAASTFQIRGGGDGHGIGLSQYGAYGYALHGYDYRCDPGPLLPGHGAGHDQSPARRSGCCWPPARPRSAAPARPVAPGWTHRRPTPCWHWPAAPEDRQRIGQAVGKSFAAPLTVTGPGPLTCPASAPTGVRSSSGPTARAAWRR